MAHISKDIKELLNKDTKTVTLNKWVYRVCIFLALLGIVAIVAGAVNSCSDRRASVVEAQ